MTQRIEAYIRVEGEPSPISIQIAGDGPIADFLAEAIHECLVGGVLTHLPVEHSRRFQLPSVPQSQSPSVPSPKTIDPHLGG